MANLRTVITVALDALKTRPETDLSMKKVSPQKLHRALQQGRVHFAFKKKNETDLRIAYGTLKLDLVPSKHHPQGKREPTPKVVTFFDLMKEQWRCVSVESEIFIQS